MGDGTFDLAKGASSTSAVIERYAGAMFDLARDSKGLDQAAGDLKTVGDLLSANPDLSRFVKTPVYSADEQLRAFNAVLAKAGIGGLAANFVRLAIRNRRLSLLPEMIGAFHRLLALHRGQTGARVTSAEALSDGEVTALKSALREKLGSDVALELAVDPSLIGGLVVKVGSRMIDTSLKTKLHQLKIAMKEVR